VKSEARRVDRGGCWIYYDPSWLRGASRSWSAPSVRHVTLGFRPVLDLQKVVIREVRG